MEWQNLESVRYYKRWPTRSENRALKGKERSLRIINYIKTATNNLMLKLMRKD